jgi:hypothetical protein
MEIGQSIQDVYTLEDGRLHQEIINELLHINSSSRLEQKFKG